MQSANASRRKCVLMVYSRLHMSCSRHSSEHPKETTPLIPTCCECILQKSLDKQSSLELEGPRGMFQRIIRTTQHTSIQGHSSSHSNRHSKLQTRLLHLHLLRHQSLEQRWEGTITTSGAGFFRHSGGGCLDLINTQGSKHWKTIFSKTFSSSQTLQHRVLCPASQHA